jgi:hypothetical protein
MTRSLILGAGFSKAISQDMPTTDELGVAVLAELARAGRKVQRRRLLPNFEQRLSRLAERQPDLTDAENLENQALFSRITQAICSVLGDRQQSVMGEAPPVWLRKLLGLAHTNRWNLITFNYDTLIECALTDRLWDWHNMSFAMPSHALRNLPAGPYVDTLGTPSADTFQLLKLHGSLDTWWVSGDTTGATITRWPLRRAWGQAVDNQSALAAATAGRVGFIVPPASAKSGFYANPLTRELWQRAARALRASAEVDLVGYSLPITDQVAGGMLADALSAAGHIVNIVNLDPDVPRRNLERLSILAAPGAKDIHGYVDEMERLSAKAAMTKLRALAPELEIAIGSTPHDLMTAGPMERAPTCPTLATLGGEYDHFSYDQLAGLRRVGPAGRPGTYVKDLLTQASGIEGLYVDVGGVSTAVIGWLEVPAPPMGGAALAVGITSMATRTATT